MTGLEAIKHSLLFFFLLMAAKTDIREMRIPNALIGTACVLRIAIFIGECLGTGRKEFIQNGLDFAGSILLVLGLTFFTLLSRHRLGFGDVKLAGVMALYIGAEATFASVFYGLLLAACTILALLASKRIGSKDKLPLAPFFLMGYLWILFEKYGELFRFFY